MSPFSNTFEGAAQYLPGTKKEKVYSVKKEKLEKLSDHVDYDQKMEKFNKYLEDIEQGVREDSYVIADMEIGVRVDCDPRNSLISVSNNSPILGRLDKKLLELGYISKRGEKNTVYTKLFLDRKASAL